MMNTKQLSSIETRSGLSPEWRENIIPYVSDVVSAYVSNNTVEVSEMSDFMLQVFSTFKNLYSMTQEGLEARSKPAVPVNQSVTKDYIICLEDGKQLKMLKRHLKAVYNMTPEQYKERWGLPATYPMVAPNYAKKRSVLAKSNGLGRVAKQKASAN